MITCNEVTLVGDLDCDFSFDHEAYDEKFYKSFISVKRTSGNIDTIPIIISENLIPNKIDNPVTIYGQYRSHNDENGKLLLYVFATDIEFNNDADANNIVLNGYICKQPTYRTTPFGRTISDLMLAIPRPNNKTDYIPVVCWGRTANETKNISVGDNITINGRIQSRNYTKNNQVLTAYEVSARTIRTSN